MKLLEIKKVAKKPNKKERKESMRKVYLIIFLLVLGLTNTGLAAEKSFKAVLSGSEVVPPVTTRAKGEATFKLSKDGKKLDYKVMVSDIENVTAAHIHILKTGETGQFVATIHTKGKQGKFSGTLAEGTITSKDRITLLEGTDFNDLIAEMKSGNAYLIVHTEKYPDGEIRGRIK